MKRGKRKTHVGVVIGAGMNKTIVVRVARRVRHPLYGKEMTLFSKCYSHDEKNEAKQGDKPQETKRKQKKNKKKR